MLENVSKKFRSLLTYKNILIVLILTAIFIVAAIYAYRNYVKKAVNIESKIYETEKGESAVSSTGAKSVDLYFFYTDWCPHCKKAKPEWEQLKRNYSGGKTVNGYKINFIEVDCEANTALAEKFNVEQFPTIKLVKGNKIIEFDAKPDVKTLEQFLSTVLAN